MYAGNNVLVNSARDSIVRNRIPYKETSNPLGYETELAEVRFNSIDVERFGEVKSEAVFVPLFNKIIFRDEFFKQRLHEYLAAHERFHEIDHKSNTGFGRLSQHFTDEDMFSAYAKFYSPLGSISASDESKRIEGTAVLFGMYYGSRPWALERNFPNAFSTIHKLHFEHGGDIFINPEYRFETRAFTYGYDESPWFGDGAYMSSIYQETGWDSFKIVRPIFRWIASLGKMFPLLHKVYDWNEDINEQWAADPRDPNNLNKKVKSGDLIIRSVRKGRVNQFAFRPL